MSKQRQKGTGFENHIRDEYLAGIWPDVERSPLKGKADYGDFINVEGIMIEARNRKTWAIPAWIRQAYDRIQLKHGPNAHKTKEHPWIIVYKGDKRGVLTEDYATVPAWYLFELIRRVKRDVINTKKGYLNETDFIF